MDLATTIRRFSPAPNQRGLTLLEIMIVVVLAGVVTLGLVGFYLQSQSMWMDASTQALAQRDATGLIEFMRTRTGSAASALVSPVPPDSLNFVLTLYDVSDNETDRFSWNPSDSLVHHTEGGVPKGAVGSATVERFYVSVDPLLPLVTIDTLRVRSTSGARIKITSTFALYNGTPAP
jgi:prepilin-type N-terminal cleavage/methylation domain-containing protein